MAITFPRAMPVLGPASQFFEVARPFFLSPTRRGRVGAMASGFPVWTAKWSLGQGMSARVSDDWRAFIDSLKGPSRLFLGHEFGREFPREYPHGFAGMTRHSGGPFSGEAQSWSQSIDSDQVVTLTLTGLPTGFRISPGDYVDFRWGSGESHRRTLVRSLEAATAPTGTAQFVINIAVPVITPSSADAHLDRPCCLMRLDPSSEVQSMDRRRVAGGNIMAIQDLVE